MAELIPFFWFLFYNMITISLLITYFKLFYRNREKERNVLIRPVNFQIYVQILLQTIIFYSVVIYLVLPKWVMIYLTYLIYSPYLFWQTVGHLNLFLLFLAFQRIIIYFDFQKLMPFVKRRGRNLVFFFIYLYSFFGTTLIERSCNKGLVCPSHRVFARDRDCQKVDKWKNILYVRDGNADRYFDYLQIIVFIDYITPCISLLLHMILHTSIRKQSMLSETRRRTEMSIFVQNVPSLVYSVIRIFFGLYIYLEYQYALDLAVKITCDQEQFHFFLIPFCYIFGSFEILAYFKNRFRPAPQIVFSTSNVSS